MKRKGDIVILTVVFVCMSCHVVGQQPTVFCEEACAVGFTCAMVKVGNADTKPGCINQYETELLAKALQERSRSSPSKGVDVPATINVQGGGGTSANTVHPHEAVHSHDTAHGIVTHRHEIPAQTAVANDSPRPTQRDSPMSLPRDPPRPLPRDPSPTNTVSNRFDFPRPSLPFRQPIPFDRFMFQRPLRFFHRGRFIPIQSLPFDSNTNQRFAESGSRPGNTMIPGLSFVSSPTDNRRGTMDTENSASSPGVIRPTFSQHSTAFSMPRECRRRCNSHLECPQSEFCGRSSLCRGAIVCQSMPVF